MRGTAQSTYRTARARPHAETVMRALLVMFVSSPRRHRLGVLLCSGWTAPTDELQVVPSGTRNMTKSPQPPPVYLPFILCLWGGRVTCGGCFDTYHRLCKKDARRAGANAVASATFRACVCHRIYVVCHYLLGGSAGVVSICNVHARPCTCTAVGRVSAHRVDHSHHERKALSSREKSGG